MLKSIKTGKDEYEIKELKICPNDLSKEEKEKEINKMLDAFVGVEEIVKREVKDDGYLYITIRINKINKLNKEKLYYLIASIFTFIIAFWAFTYTSSSKRVSHSDETFKERLAYSYCKDWVEERLKAPDTADFPFMPLRISKIDGNYYVYSYVEAENSFGVKIRKKFICVAKCDEHSCSFVNLQFEK